MNEDLEKKLKESFTPPDRRYQIQQPRLGNTKFTEKRINKYEKCGMEMVNFVNSLSPSVVLDLGCGDNQYKSVIDNLVGIDLITEYADIKADITQIPYDDNTVDVAICFGSINFGTRELIEQQLLEVKRVLKPGGYAIFRSNMKDHSDSRNIYYGWSAELVNSWTEQLNLTLHTAPELITRTNRFGDKKENWVDKVALKTNTEPRSPYRLFWIWKK
jgi:ubiquinone/menaquinone biosynthesis C-methylase UbiE